MNTVGLSPSSTPPAPPPRLRRPRQPSRLRRWGAVQEFIIIQLTHSLKLPGFNLRTYEVRNWFQTLLFQMGLLVYRYIEEAAKAAKASARQAEREAAKAAKEEHTKKK